MCSWLISWKCWWLSHVILSMTDWSVIYRNCWRFFILLLVMLVIYYGFRELHFVNIAAMLFIGLSFFLCTSFSWFWVLKNFQLNEFRDSRRMYISWDLCINDDNALQWCSLVYKQTASLISACCWSNHLHFPSTLNFWATFTFDCFILKLDLRSINQCLIRERFGRLNGKPSWQSTYLCPTSLTCL